MKIPRGYPWATHDRWGPWRAGDLVHVGDGVHREIVWFVVTSDGIPRTLTRIPGGQVQYVNTDRLIRDDGYVEQLTLGEVVA